MITALAGGVGAAKLLLGLTKVVNQKDLTVIVNTGDDIELHGLHISPDVDIVCYTLAGIVDENKGWGIRGDSFNCLEALKQFGCETWFNIGDRDLATHLFRSHLLKKGMPLSKVTAITAHALGLEATILPMTDDKFETRIITREKTLHFEEYLIKRKAVDEVLGIIYYGAEKALPAPGVVEAIEKAARIIICPSNPLVSIGTILALKGVREALRHAHAKKIAVSPIVAGSPLKGPADKLMKGLGLEVSAYAVAKLYADFIDVFIIDEADAAEKKRIEQLGVKVVTANTVMQTLDDKVQLARTVMEA